MRESSRATSLYHPWKNLRIDWAHVEVEHTDDLPSGLLADTNGIDHIRMRRRLLQVDRRCALAHELVHLEQQDTEECAPAIEDAVNHEAARRLISWGRLLAAVRWARSDSELADELWVSLPMLHARIETLRADELMEIAHAAHDAHQCMPPHEEGP